MPPSPLPVAADVVARSLYLYENHGIAGGLPAGGEPLDQDDVAARVLYTYYSGAAYGNPSGGEPLDEEDVLRRSLYLYVSITHDRDPSDVPGRYLYVYEAYTNDEPFPWIERITPTEQYPGGQVNVYGDGFGATAAAEGASVRLGVYDPALVGPGDALGVVSWSARSPNLWPANSGVRSLPALVVTVPSDAESGMLSVEETV